jgi:hypothetical protein
MSHTYTEEQLVEQPAIGLFEELGWRVASAMDEVFEPRIIRDRSHYLRKELLVKADK